jgi:hypothetical protein
MGSIAIAAGPNSALSCLICAANAAAWPVIIHHRRSHANMTRPDTRLIHHPALA